MLDWLRNRGTKQYSVDRLRGLYAELLVAIDLAGTKDLGQRRRIDKQVELSSSICTKRGEGDEPLKRDLSTAFRLLAATPAADKEGTNGGALALRDDSTVANITQAHRLEGHLVQLIRSIGEVVAFGDEAGTSFRSDAVFEYFCEKCILSLLVDIAKAKPLTMVSSSSNSLHASTWSPTVKSQVLHTVSVLVSNAQDGPSLYYLLSSNCVNELVGCILPLRQWTDPALEIMIPVYVGLLKSLVLHIASSPADIFTFLTMEEHFPLFSSTVEVAISPKSDSHARSTCLNLLVAILRIPNPPVRTWVSNADTDMHRLSTFICTRFMDRYHQMSKLLTGPVVDHLRCNAMQGQLMDLKHQIEFCNELFMAGVKAFNVQFCELFLRSVVAILLENLAPKTGQRFLPVGVSDVDVIPEPEGLAQLSAVFFVHMWSISYAPLTRMLAVALFHEKSTKLWKMAKYNAITGEYVITRELNAIVRSKSDGGGFTDNMYRREIFNVLSGEAAEWRFIPICMLVEGALASQALPSDVLVSFGLLPNFAAVLDEDNDDSSLCYPESAVETALSSFLLRQHRTKSAAATMALERASATALCMVATFVSSKDKNIIMKLSKSPLFQALATAHVRFCDHALTCRNKKTGVSDLFVDLTQLSIRSRYPKLLSRDSSTGLTYGCVLDQSSYLSFRTNPEILVRKFRTVGSNDVEDCRFAIQMALQFRATCQIIQGIASEASTTDTSVSFPAIDWADDLLLTIGDLNKKPVRGTDLDLRGRMVFNFHADTTNRFETTKKSSPGKKTKSNTNRARTLSDEVVLRPTSQLVLILDPTDIFVVKPRSRREINRGTIICGVSLRKVIAFASDQEWLHIAIRNTEDVGFLIKNGNMALHFDTIGTSLIVKQYLERSQSILRGELKDQIETLFQEQFDAIPVTVSSSEISSASSISCEEVSSTSR